MRIIVELARERIGMKGMKEMVLIGEEHSKRTAYMEKAASDMGVSLDVLGWDTVLRGFRPEQLAGKAVKIDPPAYDTAHLFHMKHHLREYRHILCKLAQAECFFLNAPAAVWTLLDKRETKRRLQKAGISVTQMFSQEPSNTEQLMEVMKRRHCYSVFVKPGYFSGAAGVAAFRMDPVHGRMRLYTSCLYREGELLNTKRILCMEDREEICCLLDKLLSLECVVERWHPKADYNGKNYDLRVVFQFGHIACMVVRQSRGPITNLHLNNQAVDVSALDLPERTVEEIAGICEQSLSVFPGLAMAGVDILLERGTMRPLVIEMNGQGDLIYQDIYGENKIYREQVQRFCR